MNGRTSRRSRAAALAARRRLARPAGATAMAPTGGVSSSVISATGIISWLACMLSSISMSKPLEIAGKLFTKRRLKARKPEPMSLTPPPKSR